MHEASYTDARQHFARLLDRVTDDREIVVIRRRGRARVAMIAADELDSLQETVHLVRSPRNALRLFSALDRALKGKGKTTTVAALRRKLGLSG